MKHFFISYNSADRIWAEWIAWQLEEAGYTTVIQAWDFRPGSNFVLEMQRAATEAERTIAVVSPDYPGAPFPQSEWAAAFRRDPTGEKGTLLPVRVRECDLEGLLPQMIYIDLVGLEEAAAQDTLLAGVRRERAKPATPPGFPGAAQRSVTERPHFPGALPPMQESSLAESPPAVTSGQQQRGCSLGVVILFLVPLALCIGLLVISGVLILSDDDPWSALSALIARAPTSTPTKTPGTVVSPASADTPTLTPTPTPYYVEIVVDASERMGDEFESGTTKMESAWQTAGTIARIRAQRGQFVSIRTFGSGGEQTDMGCFESYSVFPFTNQDSEVKAHLMTPSIPGGPAAVVTALTDASAELMAYENIGREIILLTGGDDECGSSLLAFYASENRSLWTRTFVVLFADEDFGPFIELRAQGADVNYSLVKNAAQAQKAAEEIADNPPPTPPTALSSPSSLPTPTFTPKPPPPSKTGGVATAIRPPTPATTQPPAPTSTSTDTPTAAQTPTRTPTATRTPTHTPTPTNTPVIPTPEVTYDPGSRTITIHPGDAEAQTGRLCKGKMADVDRKAVFLRAAYLQAFGIPAGSLATVTHVYAETSTLNEVEVGQYNDVEIDASGEPLYYTHCAFDAVKSMRNQLGLPLELDGFNNPPRWDHGTITIQLSGESVGFVSKGKSVEPGIFAASDQANMAGRASAFNQFYWKTAAINGTTFSPGSNDGTSYQLAYDRVGVNGSYSGWEIVLPETDVSNLSKLAFDIRGQSGGEIPNVWLGSPPAPHVRNFVDIEDYVTVNTSWQRVEIPLADFHVKGGSQTIDLKRIIQVQIVFEWETMAGMVYVDGFAFEP